MSGSHIMTMNYQKFVYGETIIEFHNSWLGEEMVIANGQQVSHKSSVWGTSHRFTVMEDGHLARYTLTTRVNEMMQIVLDLARDGELVYDTVPAPYNWGASHKKRNKAKRMGLQQLKDYDLHDALKSFETALQIDPGDPEIHFHMACAYSVLENVEDGFESIRKAVNLGLADHSAIVSHDMLAYLRMHSAFNSFLASGFKRYALQESSQPEEGVNEDQ